MKIELDNKGAPVLLANVAPSGIAKLDPNAKSGNDAHDTSSGKFAPKSGESKPAAPQIDNVAYFRLLDAVRDAAREFQGNISVENVTAFIRKRAKNPESVDVQQFITLVQQQNIADIVDIIDGATPGGKRPVKVSAPRSYIKKVLAAMTDDDVAEIIHRLESRGNKPEIMDKFIIGKRLPKERQESVRSKKEKFQASAEWEVDPIEQFLMSEERVVIDYDED